MSRGLGVMQRYLLHMIGVHGKPVTFDDLRKIILSAENAPPGAIIRLAIERSLRRALQSLVRDHQVLTTVGKGGRADPLRYALNPMVAAMAGDEETFQAQARLLRKR